MEFRRIHALPPYAFAQIDALKMSLRRAGEDVVDLAFGNPDLPSPDIAVDKLVEAVRNPRNHRYSTSKGIPKLREAVTALYERKFGVTLDFETEVCSTIGAKEGFSHLMLALLGPGDTALVPSPSYPIHIWGPIIAGAGVHYVRMGPDQNFFENLHSAYEQAWPRPRVIVASFPHNPTTACVDLAFMTELVEFAREREIVVVHDFAYADLGFDGYEPPSILQVPGAKDVAVELYTLTKSFSMAGWRMGFLVGNSEIVAALGKLKSYLDYGSFQPIQIAATVAMNEAPDFPKEVNEIYRKRRDTLIDGLDRLGWHIEKPKGTMFVWARIPEPYAEMTSIEFTTMCVQEAKVAIVSRERVRAGRRGLHAFCVGREREAHPTGDAPDPQGSHQARLSGLALTVVQAQSPSRQNATHRSATSPTGRLSSMRAWRVNSATTPWIACARSAGSRSAMRPSTMPSFRWRIVSAIEISRLRARTGAKVSSVAANWMMAKYSRCSANHTSEARIPSSIRRTGSASSPMACCWRLRSSWFDALSSSARSSSFEAKYQ